MLSIRLIYCFPPGLSSQYAATQSQRVDSQQRGLVPNNLPILLRQTIVPLWENQLAAVRRTESPHIAC
jgi:hypothetical protein